MYSPFKDALQIYLPKQQITEKATFNPIGCGKNFKKLYLNSPSQQDIQKMQYISTCYTNSLGYDYQINTFLDSQNRVTFQIRSFQKYKKYVLKFLTPNVKNLPAIGKKQQKTVKKIMKFNKHSCIQRHNFFAEKFEKVDSDKVYQCWSLLSVYHQANLDDNFLSAFYGLSFLEIVSFFLIRSYAMDAMLFRLPAIEYHGNQKFKVPVIQIQKKQQNDEEELTQPQDNIQKQQSQNQSQKGNSQKKQYNFKTDQNCSEDKISYVQKKQQSNSSVENDSSQIQTNQQEQRISLNCSNSCKQMEDISFDSDEIQDKNKGPQLKVTWNKDLSQMKELIRLQFIQSFNSHSYLPTDYRLAIHNKTFWINEEQDLELQQYNPPQFTNKINPNDPIEPLTNIYGDQFTERQNNLMDWKYAVYKKVYQPKFKQMGIINIIRTPNMNLNRKPHGQFKRISQFKIVDYNKQKIVMSRNQTQLVDQQKKKQLPIVSKQVHRDWGNSSSEDHYGDFNSQQIVSDYDS